MKTNYKKLFDLAKQEGIAELQIAVRQSESVSFSYFQGDVESYKAKQSASLTAAAIVDGKLAFYGTEKFAPADFPEIVSGLKEAAKYKEETSDIGLFPGAEKYKQKKAPANKPDVPMKEKIAAIKDVAERLIAADSRILPTVEVEYREAKSESVFLNSYGLKLKDKSQYCYAIASVPAKEGNEVKNGLALRFANDFSSLDLEGLYQEALEDTLARFGGTGIKSGHYPTVLKNSVVASLIPVFVGAASAEEVEKKTTFLLDKIDAQVASSKVTISEKPLERTSNYYYFDDEGVPAKTKDIVKKGILTTYLHNRATAKRFGVESTGNGSYGTGKFSVSPSGNLFLKPRKKSFEEMISKIKKGVYITNVEGLGTGMNETSGDFSCQASGYLIEDGKVSTALPLITLGGNLMQMLLDVKDLDNRVSRDGEGAFCPDLYIKKMSIGGE